MTQQEHERGEAWFERHLKMAPPITWEHWAAATAALGITVRPRSINTHASLR